MGLEWDRMGCNESTACDLGVFENVVHPDRKTGSQGNWWFTNGWTLVLNLKTNPHYILQTQPNKTGGKCPKKGDIQPARYGKWNPGRVNGKGFEFSKVKQSTDWFTFVLQAKFSSVSVTSTSFRQVRHACGDLPALTKAGWHFKDSSGDRHRFLSATF